MRTLWMWGLSTAVAGAGCSDVAVGPIGPGGKANVLRIEDGQQGSVDLEAVRAFALADTSTVVLLVVEGDLSPPDDAPFTNPGYVLELGLDRGELEVALPPLELPVTASAQFSLAADGRVAWTDRPGRVAPGPMPRLRLTGPCLSCEPSPTPGQQRFEGRLRVLEYDGFRIELDLDLDFRGPTPTEPEPFELTFEAYLDLALPAPE